MSNPEKAPMYSAGDQHGGGLLPTAQPGQENPSYDNSAPPVYEQGTSELPSDEKQQQPPQYAPPPGVGSSQSATDEKQRLAQQYIPPPPPGPPPAEDQHQQSGIHPNPLQGNPVAAPQQQQATHQPIDTQQEQKNYAIPQYDPAHPTFAPPPTNPTNPTNEPSQPTTAAPVHSEPFGHGNDQPHGYGAGSGMITKTIQETSQRSCLLRNTKSPAGVSALASLVSRPRPLSTTWRTSSVARVSSPRLLRRSATRQLLFLSPSAKTVSMPTLIPARFPHRQTPRHKRPTTRLSTLLRRSPSSGCLLTSLPRSLPKPRVSPSSLLSVPATHSLVLPVLVS
ncbi:hypothetical protein NXS19_002121 [Fusarium pseudograminearum]|nr:hypothetical protein NXS19_002121 [Fusarium pseudograminearum]